MSATVFLVPSTLGELAPIDTLPAHTLSRLRALEHWVVETPKQARRFLKAAGIAMSERKLSVQVLDEHTPDERLSDLLAPALAGFDIGVLSDAGCPAIADPGARLVRLAHERSLAVVPLAGNDLVRPLGIIQRRGKNLGVTARRFIELLRREGKTQGAGTLGSPRSGAEALGGEGVLSAGANGHADDHFVDNHPRANGRDLNNGRPVAREDSNGLEKANRLLVGKFVEHSAAE